MNDEPRNLSDLAQVLIDATPDSRLRDHCLAAQLAIDAFTAHNQDGWSLHDVLLWNVITTQWRVILIQHQRIQALEAARSAGGGEGGA